jgi:hypothetical protein
MGQSIAVAPSSAIRVLRCAFALERIFVVGDDLVPHKFSSLQ